MHSKKKIKKKIFSYTVDIYDDETSNQNIELEAGYEEYCSEFLFAMVSGTIAASLLKQIKTKYPKEYVAIEKDFTELCNDVINKSDEMDENDPYVRASEVFSPSQGMQS